MDGIAYNGTDAFGDTLSRIPIDNEIDALHVTKAP